MQCHEVFQLASKYLRHRHADTDVDPTKTNYMTLRRRKILEHVDRELYSLAKGRKWSREPTRQDVGKSQRVKLDVVDVIANPPEQVSAVGFDTVLDQNTVAMPPDLQSAPPFVARQTTTGFGLESEGPAPEYLGFHAPVNMVVNFPKHPAWPGWLPDDGIGHQTLGSVGYGKQ